MNAKISFETNTFITSEQMQEIMSILEVQNTTDREVTTDTLELIGEYGTYTYRIDEHYNVIIENVER